jgi:hypothetical protein
LLLLSFLFTGPLVAQINAPDLQCVRNDTLFWEIPTNTCGPFSSYDIFFSTAPTGPFNPLASITTPATDLFFHNNPAGETFYYYMVTDANCPGEIQLSSDTLNNESPERSPINYVSVNNGLVEIEWTPSSSPEVTNYIIYRTSPVGALPIDTVDANATQYLDLTSDPLGQSESYFVLAMDACGNTSVFDLPHFTVFLETTVDPCDRSIRLDWNRYRNWPQGIQEQEVWLSTDNDPFVLIETLSAQDSTYTFRNTNDGAFYCFYINAIAEGTAAESRSNERCLTLNIVEPVRDLFLKNVSVTDDNQVEFTWTWNDNAEVAGVAFEEGESSGALSIIGGYNPSNNINFQTTRLAPEADPTNGRRFYRITVTDDCDSTAISNVVPLIHLSGFPLPDQSNQITWTPLGREGAIVDDYDIYRIVDGQATYTNTVAANVTQYIDGAIDITNPAEANICYYVVANATVITPQGEIMPIASQSNTTCVEQFSDLIVPNAFVPEGVNKEFKPRLVFGTEVEYEMRIFDRWGKQVFESFDPNRGWNGRDGFFYYPAGVYTYVIRITQTNGRTVEKQGVVALLR